MIRVNKLVDYAVIILIGIAKNSQTLPSSSVLSKTTHIALPTTKKVLKLLSASTLVESTVGSKGGYRLARNLADISLKDVVDAVRGTEMLKEAKCGKLSTLVKCKKTVCSKKGHWFELQEMMNQMLATYRLDQLLDCYK